MAKLAKLRDKLQELGVDGVIVGSGDAHQSEYVTEIDMRRAFISDFTGSSGTTLILQNEAYLWTDGRYFLQATTQLSSEWTLMKSGEPGVLELNDWIIANIPSGRTIGVDPFLIAASQAKALEKILQPRNITLKALATNPIDEIWQEYGRPSAPKGAILCHDIALAGVSHSHKINNLQNELKAWGARAIVLSMLDEIMWLYNIRGSDVNYNPVAISYAVVSVDKAYLFVDAEKANEKVINHFEKHVEILPYDQIESFLAQESAVGKVVCDPIQLNWKLYRAINSSNLVEKVSPITMLKSKKNDDELRGIRQAHVRDGVALTAFLHWLTNEMRNPDINITEYDVTVKLEEFRSKMPGHVGPSFSTIAGYGTNGAIIHYKPEKNTAAKLGVDSLFLLDSGAQYNDGTTDVTRTLHFGTPTQRMMDCFTLVLLGHIAIAKVIFPEGTLGSRIDCLARVPLWQHGLDFLHGTGHGVGAFLNVHEGPQGIGFRKRDNEAGFTPGMTTSNEPGYYEDGAFGIRIENVCITVDTKTPNNFNNRRYCCFDTITLAPIQTRLINRGLMTPGDLEWVNNYHKQVRETLLPLMETHFPESVDYLIEQTQPF